MNKRVLLIAFHFPPQATSSGVQRTLSFSKYLVDFGWKALVLSADPKAYDFTNSSQLTSIPEDLVVKRAFALDSKRHFGIFGRYPGILALPDRWISWSVSAIPIGISMIRRYKPAIIWSTFPISTAFLIGLAIHRITGLPWVADFRDPMLQTNFPNRKLQRKIFEWIEHATIHGCDAAIFTTCATMNSYKQRFPKFLHEKFAVIENGYDEDTFSGIAPEWQPKPFRDEKKQLTLLHSGTLYADDRDPTAFFRAIAMLKENCKLNELSLNIILRATGDDYFFNKLIIEHGVSDIITVAPPLPYAEALSEICSVDGLIVFQGRSVNAQIPAKIYEYLRARKPIFGLIDPNGETARLFASAGLPNIVSMDSVPDIISAFDDFLIQIRSGHAHIASDDFIASASRKNRTADLVKIFNRIAEASDA